MRFTQGALGMLVQRYRGILKNVTCSMYLAEWQLAHF